MPRAQRWMCLCCVCKYCAVIHHIYNMHECNKSVSALHMCNRRHNIVYCNMKNIILKVISELRWEKLLVIAVPLLHLDDKRKIEKTERKQRERCDWCFSA